MSIDGHRPPESAGRGFHTCCRLSVTARDLPVMTGLITEAAQMPDAAIRFFS